MQNQELPQVYYVHEVELIDGKPAAKKGAPPLGCVAVKQFEDGTITRGISIRSHADNWRYKTGRNKAIKRCYDAFHNRTNTLPIGEPVQSGDGQAPRDVAIMFQAVWLDNYGGNSGLPGYKSSFTPTLTDFEKQILAVRAERSGRVGPSGECGELGPDDSSLNAPAGAMGEHGIPAPTPTPCGTI